MSALDNDEMLLNMRQSLAKKRVLIVDRHPPARDALRIMLSSLGVTSVHGAGNSADVIRQVKAHRFDIILSDFVLDDGRDGQQLLEELRHAHLIPLSTLYMIITSERAYTNVVALAELAPDDYLIKPFTSEQLMARLVKAIYRKHVLRRVYQHVERGALQEAIVACHHVIMNHTAYRYDALRFNGQLLQALGKFDEAEAIFRLVLEAKVVPWAKMGLAVSLRERAELDEAADLAEQVIAEAPQFLAAYDFLASVHEAKGKLQDAQQALQRAADVSPHNTQRQKLVGDLAVRNNDLEAAEKAFSKVMQRNQGSSLRSVDDFINLSRILIERGDITTSRKLMSDLRREWRGVKQAEFAALISEGLCLMHEGNPSKAGECIEHALTMKEAVDAEAANKGRQPSQRLAIDLAHACLQAGKVEDAHRILRKVAAENNDDPRLIEQITRVYEKTGHAEAGKAMLDQVGAEIIELNNRGVLAARSGDLEGAVQLLIQAAEQVPNLQFLVNAAKAIFTLLDKKGWDEELAEKGRNYLELAMRKDRNSPKVMSAREVYTTVSRKFGVSTEE